MSNYELSKYQKDILNFIESKSENLLVDAKAGSGKTSTLVMIANRIIEQNKKCIFLAFNKSIVQELRNRIISDDCEIKTLHSLGLSFLRSYFYRKHGKDYSIEIDTGKVKPIILKFFDTYCLASFREANSDLSIEEFKDLQSSILKELNDLIHFCRYYNVDYRERNQIISLMYDHCRELRDYKNIGMIDFPKIIESSMEYIKYLFENPEQDEQGNPVYVIDYTDMIYFPCLYRMNTPYSLKDYTNFIMVDECIPGDMFVTTNKGKKKIKTLYTYYKNNKLNDLKVKTFNETIKKFEYKEIVNIKQKDTRYIYEIETYGLNKIQATDNHPFLTQNGWKRLDELKIDEDYVYLDNIQNQKCKLIPNDDQLQVIYGTSLGDGNLIKGNNYEYRLRITQGQKQYEYFKFKKDLLQCNYEYISNGGYEAHTEIYTTTTRQFLMLVKNKIEIIDKLDERGLAILYMDDGSCTQKNPYSTIHISCNSFSEEETDHLIKKFKEFDIDVINYPHYNTDGKKYNEIKMNTENGHKFLKLIAPYMNKSCFYKNPKAIGNYKWNNKWEEFGGNIIKSITKIRKDIVYDMEVKDNHNFIISKCNSNPKGSGFVVHNCQDLSILQQLFIKRLDNGKSRYICVGDRNQAIYSFAGADTKSVDNLKKNLFLTESPLNICYRCPENVIKIAKELVPEIDWNKSREDKGEIEFFNIEDLKDLIKPGDVIIGRRNRDLIKLYKELMLKYKVQVKFKNAEMVNALVNDLAFVCKTYIKFYNKNQNIEVDLYEYLKGEGLDIHKGKFTDEENAFIKRKAQTLIKSRSNSNKPICRSNYNLDYLQTCMTEYKEKGAYNYIKEDQEEHKLKEYYDLILDLIELYKENHTNNLLKDFLDFLSNYFKGNLNKNLPIISSIHMMKGGEADNVFILDYPKFPYVYNGQSDEDQQQEKNLQYVAVTRAKKKLYLGIIDNPLLDKKTDELNSECRRKIKDLLS